MMKHEIHTGFSWCRVTAGLGGVCVPSRDLHLLLCGPLLLDGSLLMLFMAQYTLLLSFYSSGTHKIDLVQLDIKQCL